jgi:hypothetical protein
MDSRWGQRGRSIRVAAGRKNNKKSLCRSRQDIGTNDSDRTVNSGRTDGPGASRVSNKEAEPTRKMAPADWGYVGTKRWTSLDGMGRKEGCTGRTTLTSGECVSTLQRRTSETYGGVCGEITNPNRQTGRRVLDRCSQKWRGKSSCRGPAMNAVVPLRLAVSLLTATLSGSKSDPQRSRRVP